MNFTPIFFFCTRLPAIVVVLAGLVCTIRSSRMLSLVSIERTERSSISWQTTDYFQCVREPGGFAQQYSIRRANVFDDG